MDRHKILCGLSATLLLLNGTVSYASAATPFNTYIGSTATNSAISGSTVTDSISQEKNNPIQEELVKAPVVKKPLRKSSSTEGMFDNKTYTHADAFDGMNIYNGIDVSYYNKTIDWEEVKESGVDFAIIRAGYRGYGASGTLCTDTKFVENIEGALEAGIQTGVYYFTEAINKKEAIEEAKYCLEKIKDYDITLPVVIDYEFPTDANGPIGRMYKANLSKSAATNNCIAFCDTIKAAGYEPMIYANPNDFTKLINGKKLGQSYKIWLANYTTKTTYSNPYEYWQYTSSGSVDGISGKVDCNFWYTDNNLGGSNNGDNDNNTVITVPPASTTTPVVTEKPAPTPKPTATPKPAVTPKPTVTPKPVDTNRPIETISLAGAAVQEIPAETYTGDEIMPEIVVSLDGNELIEYEDYEVTYSNNINAGKAIVTITGIGAYTGTITSEFIIKPDKTSWFTGIPANKNITLQWYNDTGAQGYQIYRADVYKGTYKKIKTITNSKVTSFKNTKLLPDHEYYYKIRSYVKIDGKIYYSGFTTLTAATMKTRQAAITNSKLYLLKTPASGSAKLITLPKNSTIEYLGKTYLSNNQSFMHVSYMVKSKTYNGYLPVNTSLKYYSLGRTTAALNIRKAACTNKKVLAVIPLGTPVALLKKVRAESKVWYKTNYYDGKKLYTGYISSGYIQK